MEEYSHERGIKSEKEYRAYYLNRLELLMNDFSDEVPTEIIHSPDTDNQYKVRAAWWSSIGLNMYGLEQRGLIPKEFGDEYRQICELHQKNLDETGRTKTEDIKAINALINKVIQSLQDQE